MNRRNVLIGLTAAATGSSVVFGSGAFTQVQADRSLTIGVSEDDSALLALDAGDNVASVYNDDSDDNDVGSTGELVVNTNELTDNDDNNGFNAGATVQIGALGGQFDTQNPASTDVNSSDKDNVAFTLTNNFDSVPGSSGTNTIGVTIDLSTIENDVGSEVTFIGTEPTESNTKSANYSGTSGDNMKFTLSPDDVVYFAIVIETASTESPTDFGGTVKITANPT
jgi:hypothetical protein